MHCSPIVFLRQLDLQNFAYELVIIKSVSTAIGTKPKNELINEQKYKNGSVDFNGGTSTHLSVSPSDLKLLLRHSKQLLS